MRKQITLKQLKGQLFTFNTWNKGSQVQYDITENFPKHGERSYTIHNLDIKKEKNNLGEYIVSSSTNDEILSDCTRVLNVFSPKLVQVIHDDIEDDKTYIATIQFADGCIEIRTDLSELFEK
jgi:rRNA maturation protein Rpf1